MGDGLKRVAKLCGGLIATSGGKTVRYNANGKQLSIKGENMTSCNNGFWDLPAEERATRMETECERNEVDNFFDLSPEERGRAYYGNEDD